MTESAIALDLAVVRDRAVEIAREGADVLMEFFGGPLRESFKSTEIDLVTEADKAAEDVLLGALRQHFSEHAIVSEEGGEGDVSVEEAPYRWYVDPLDGTVNFANGIPIWSVSLALTDAQMNPLVGVVFNPVSGELFTAIKGQGAALNGQSIQVSETTSLRNSVVASGFPYDKHTSPDNNLKQWGGFLVLVRGVRRLGSAALDGCYVACGRLDGYWEPTLNPWDCLAGALCVMESGGTVSDYRGDETPSAYGSGPIVASNGHVHAAMLEVLGQG